MQKRPTHDERERAVVIDCVESQFPNFAGNTSPWNKIPDGQDPPDFISENPRARIGLELREWLDGDQMGNAKMWESIAIRFNEVLSEGWEQQFQPQHCNWVMLELREPNKLEAADEPAFGEEFFKCVARIDTLNAQPFGIKHSFFRMQDLGGYPTLHKYLMYILFFGGKPIGSRWFMAQRSRGVFDSNSARSALENAIDDKMLDYTTVGKKAHLAGHRLTEINLLIYGGLNISHYNAPWDCLRIEEIARFGSEYCAAQRLRQTFGRAWFFYGVDNMPEFVKLVGLKPEEGKIRWMAQLWPEFPVLPGGRAPRILSQWED